jgi:CRISPR-associated protein Csx17
MTGRDVVADGGSVVQRRLIEAAARGERCLPLEAAAGCGARMEDVAAFLDRRIDFDKLLGLALGLMAIDWAKWSPSFCPAGPASPERPGEAWLAVRLCGLPPRVAAGYGIPAEPAMVRRLLAGDSAGALSTALARLRSAGIRPPLQAAVTDPATARRWAAALVFPIDRRSARRAAAAIDPTLEGVIHA